MWGTGPGLLPCEISEIDLTGGASWVWAPWANFDHLEMGSSGTQPSYFLFAALVSPFVSVIAT
jgi:hypothetical protein